VEQSRLYEAAVASLGASRAQWEAAAQRIAATEGPDLRNQSGAAILANIQAEEQLSADPGQADSALLAGALTELAAAAWPDTAAGFRNTFVNALDAFRLKGTQISFSPAMLHRYIQGPGFLRALAKALANAGHDTLATVLHARIEATARGEPTETWQSVVDLIRTPGVWAALVANPIAMAPPGRSMFVTFDAPAPTDRRSARRLHAALALCLDCQECFLEIRYPTQSDDKLLFPTFADAGWFSHFRGARAGEPHGWTRPHSPLDPEDDRQPEAVQETQTLARLPSADHLRAVPP